MQRSEDDQSRGAGPLQGSGTGYALEQGDTEGDDYQEEAMPEIVEHTWQERQAQREMEQRQAKAGPEVEDGLGDCTRPIQQPTITCEAHLRIAHLRCEIRRSRDEFERSGWVTKRGRESSRGDDDKNEDKQHINLEAVGSSSENDRNQTDQADQGSSEKQKKGKGLCPHGKQRRGRCKECGGSRFCQHGKIKYVCKECGGRGICEHGKRRTECKKCGGSQMCEHKRRRSKCKMCQGSSICTHGRERPKCKECGGSSFCKHGRQRSRCKDCGGTGICEHGRIRVQCKECGGSRICEHRRKRSTCNECGGSEVCEHNKQRSKCKECNKKCPHGEKHKDCLTCRGSGMVIDGIFIQSHSQPQDQKPSQAQ